ncbi:MAG: hypothetical protein AAGD18_18445 [Actinomycetota bacterium]
MNNYLLTFHGPMEPMSEDPAEIEALKQEWGIWFAEIGDAVVDGGAPVEVAASIDPSGAEIENPASISGYTIIRAEHLAAAVEMARGCPVLREGHSIQVSEGIDI